MIFNSLIFIFFFLPVSLILYYLTPSTYFKNIVLLIISLLFYSWNDPVTLILLVLSILWNYISGIQIAKETKHRKLIIVTSIAFNVLILCIYKYIDMVVPFEIDTSHVPIGLSFFTFSAISYLGDVITKKAEPQRDIVLFSLYICFFGKISSGPIVTYSQMQSQLKSRIMNRAKFNAGMVLFIKGLIKKIIFADQFALVFQALSDNDTVLGTWLYAISYALQLYFDFSGYSDMAIGISKMFGFDFDINFDHPYMSKTIQEFFRRWHISLGNWFKNYVYFPLGGSRVNNTLYVRNILIVWFLTGIWHGANITYIIWGLYLGLFVLMEKFFLKKALKKLPKFISHIYTLLVVLIGWVFFFSPSLLSAFDTLLRMFGVGASSFMNSDFLFVFTSYLVLIVFGIFFTTTIYDKLQIFSYNHLKNKGVIITSVVYIVFFVVCISMMVGSTYQSFLYSAF